MRTSAVHLISSDPLANGSSLAVPLQSNAMVIASGTLSGSFVGPAFDVLQLNGWSATATITGVVGTPTWQASNDVGTSAYNPTGIVNWVPFPNLNANVACVGATPDQTLWNVEHQNYHWIRFAWVHTSGTGSIDVSITAKGFQ